MSFYWNAFGPVNLGLDLAITFTFYALAFIHRRRWPDSGLVAACRRGLIGAVLLWVLAGAFVGGIVGFSLIVRTFWTLFTVAIPLLLVFFAIRLKKAVLLLPALLLLVFKFYGEVYEPNNLEVQRASIAVKGLKVPIKIAHISDLQTDDLRAMHLEAQRSVNDFAPDLIFFTGDLINHPSIESEIQVYLRGFKSRSGSFAVSGNIDMHLNLSEFYKDTGFTVLDGDFRKIKVEGNSVGVVGLGLDNFADRSLLVSLLEKLGRVDVTLLLSHVPDTMATAKGLSVTALFSGHTHGGQMCPPWGGPILTLSGVSRKIAAGGIQQVEGLSVVVSRGLGMEGHVAPRVRTFCRPQVLLLELKPR